MIDMKLLNNNENNKAISAMKGFAIFSVVSAHTATGSSQNFFEELTLRLMESIGIIGVIIFFFLSGYLFGGNSKNFSQFWLRKLQSIIIPWLFTGSIVYYISALAGTNQKVITLQGWFLFLIGNDTYLYFVPVLLICYLLTYLVRKKNSLLILTILVSFASIILTGLDVLLINPYLNIFNWLGYFSIGLLVFNNHSIIIKFSNYIQKAQNSIIIGLMFVSIFCFVIILLSDNKIDYWSFYPLIFGYLLIFLNCIVISNNSKLSILCKLGDNSYTIYLLHMPVAGFINILLKNFMYISILKPFIVILITVLTIQLISILSQKIGFGYHIRVLFGIR